MYMGICPHTERKEGKTLLCTIQQLQEYELEMVKYVTDICDRHNIPYYLHAGSALGAIRHKGPIPWDYDTDIMVPENEIKRFILVVGAELPDKYYVNTMDNDDEYYTLFPRIGLSGYSTEELHLDVFRMIGAPESVSAQKKLVKRAAFLRKCVMCKVRKKGDLNRKERILKTALLPIPKSVIVRLFDRLCNAVPFDQAKWVTNPFGRYGMKNMFRKEVYGKGVMVEYGGMQVRVAEQTDFYLKQYYKDYTKLPPEDKRKKAMEMIYTVEEKHV